MVQIDKEAKRQKSKLDKSKATMEWRNPIRIKDCEEESSSSSMSMYNLDSNREYLEVPSNRSPTVVIHDVPLPMHMEEVHSSPLMEKFRLKGIIWFKNKIILPVIISRKYFVPLLSTFAGIK